MENPELPAHLALLQCIKCSQLLHPLHCRSAVCAHRAALLTQRSFWRVLLKERVKYDDLEECLAALGKAELKATAVYRR